MFNNTVRQTKIICYLTRTVMELAKKNVNPREELLEDDQGKDGSSYFGK